MVITRENLDKINKGTFDKDFLKLIEEVKKELANSKYKTLNAYFENNEEILIKNRILQESANNKILANYARYITTINVGYFIGSPVKYSVIDLPGDEEKKVNIAPVIDLYKKNAIHNIDKANSINVSKYGKAYELIYINEDTEIKSKSISPEQAIILKSDDLDEKELVGIYIVKNDNEEKIYLYTEQKEYVINNKNGQINILREKENILKIIPLIELKNNEEEIGDYEKVTSLIDAYNKIISNDVDNIEEFVDSILLIQGQNPVLTYEQARILRETRAMAIEEGTASYLTKILDETGITTALLRLSRDIHKFSFTPDMSDENFAGTQSGVALEYKLLPFELHMKSKQAQYEKALRQRFKIYNTFLNILSNAPVVDIDIVNIEFVRGLPKNDVEVADMITKLKGIVTDKTLLSRLSFVQNPEEESESVKMENEARQKKAMLSMIETGGEYKEAEKEKEELKEK